MLLPAPFGPVMATVSPARMRRSKPASSGSRPGYAKSTCSNAIQPGIETFDGEAYDKALPERVRATLY